MLAPPARSWLPVSRGSSIWDRTREVLEHSPKAEPACAPLVLLSLGGRQKAGERHPQHPEVAPHPAAPCPRCHRPLHHPWLFWGSRGTTWDTVGGRALRGCCPAPFPSIIILLRGASRAAAPSCSIAFCPQPVAALLGFGCGCVSFPTDIWDPAFCQRLLPSGRFRMPLQKCFSPSPRRADLPSVCSTASSGCSRGWVWGKSWLGSAPSHRRSKSCGVKPPRPPRPPPAVLCTSDPAGRIFPPLSRTQDALCSWRAPCGMAERKRQGGEPKTGGLCTKRAAGAGAHGAARPHHGHPLDLRAIASPEPGSPRERLCPEGALEGGVAPS